MSNLVPGAPRIEYQGQTYYLLDEAPLAEFLRQEMTKGGEVVHLMGIDKDGELAVYLCTPENLSDLLAKGRRLPPES